MRKTALAGLLILLTFGAGCANLAEPISQRLDDRIARVIDQEFCQPLNVHLKKNPHSIRRPLPFDLLFYVDAYVNPFTYMVNVNERTMAWADSDKEWMKGKTQAERFQQHLVHEYLHVVWFQNLVDQEAFERDAAKFLQCQDYGQFIQFVEQGMESRNFINRWLFGSAELYSEIGEHIGLDSQLPDYLLKHYRLILKNATEEPWGNKKPPSITLTARRSN